jgi:phage antirepressor YoqD-like protein
LTDSVAVDAKRILLRYGAPIAVLDKVSESHRIEFARAIAKTMLPAREPRLRELLAEHGYMEAAPVTKKGRGKGKPMAQAGSKAKGEKAKTTTKTTKKKR